MVRLPEPPVEAEPSNVNETASILENVACPLVGPEMVTPLALIVLTTRDPDIFSAAIVTSPDLLWISEALNPPPPNPVSVNTVLIPEPEWVPNTPAPEPANVAFVKPS